MNTNQLIDEVGAIVHSMVTATKATSLNDRFSLAFQAGLKAFAAAFVASLFASASNLALPETPPTA